MLVTARRSALVILVPTILLAGCGSGSISAGESTSSAPPTPTTVSSSPPAPSDSPSDTGRRVVLGNDDDLELQRNGERVTVQCDGEGDVDIEADNVVVTALGNCGQISVDGRSNIVTVAAAKELEVDGVGNQINATTIATVDIDGTRHIVKIGVIERELRVQGKGNDVRYGGSPRTDFHQDDSDASGQDAPNDDDGNDTETGSDP